MQESARAVEQNVRTLSKMCLMSSRVNERLIEGFANGCLPRNEVISTSTLQGAESEMGKLAMQSVTAMQLAANNTHVLAFKGIQ